MIFPFFSENLEEMGKVIRTSRYMSHDTWVDVMKKTGLASGYYTFIIENKNFNKISENYRKH